MSGHPYKFLIFVFVISAQMTVQAQIVTEPVLFSGKKYLSEMGHYLNFLNNDQAIFNVDTFQYRVKQDTIHLEKISWLIGETRQQFTQRYIYSFLFFSDRLKLVDANSSYVDKENAVIFFKDITTKKGKLNRLKSFTITRSEYLTWSGETGTDGIIARKETVYLITSVTISRNRRLTTVVRNRTVFQTPNDTTYQDQIISKETRRLSGNEYNRYINQLNAQHPKFLKGNIICGKNSLHYTFLYKSRTGIHTYKRCWLNELEVPIANWTVAK